MGRNKSNETKFIGHDIGHNEFLNNTSIFEGKMMGRRPREGITEN